MELHANSSPGLRHADLLDMRSCVWFVVAFLAVIPGCADDADTAHAAATFVAFQDALQHRDTAGCRKLLTTESAAALDAMPWERIAGRLPLQVLGATNGKGEFRVQVADPNDGGRVAEFVVVREYGRLVVDLVATAGLHVEVVEGAGAHEELVPRELTAADYDRIRQHELAQPPR